MTGGTSRGAPPPPAEWAAPGTAGPAAYAEPVYAPPPPPKPGVIPLRPLTVGELMVGSLATIRRHPRATFGLSAAVAVVQQGANLFVDLGTGDVTAPDATGASTGGTVAGIASYAVGAVLSALLLGMLSVVVADAVIGRDVSLGQAWTRVRPVLPALLGASLLAALLPVVGLAALVLPGVFLWVVLSFTTPALVLERLSVGRALRRSWRLATPLFWRVLGIRLLATLLAGLMASLVALPGLLAAISSFTDSIQHGQSLHLTIGTEVAVRLSSLVATALTAPFLAGVVALLYVDCRMRRESLDVTLARAAESVARAASHE